MCEPFHCNDSTNSPQWSSRKLIVAACTLVAGQAVVIATLGHQKPGPLLSDLIQLVLGSICSLACVEAFRRSNGIARYAWRLLAVTFVVWAVAQVLGVYLDISGSHLLDSVDDILFFLSVIPFGLLAFLDPDGEPNHFDRLHIFDFVQVCIFWVSIFLCFSPRMWSPATAFHIGHFTWSRNISFDGVLVATFLIRALLANSRAVRSLFWRMGVFLILSGIADSYALNPQQDLQPGGWFDLIWSILLAIPILIAATWKRADDGESDGSPKSQRVVVNQVFPLLYPLGSFLILTRIHGAYPALSILVFALAFVTFAARAMVIQYRQTESKEALRQSEIAYRLLFDSNPLPMWVFERTTLKFLAVNEAVCRQYGFSSQEFLTMTIADIRPEEDIPDLLEVTTNPVQGFQKAGGWRHRKKDGTVIHVEISSHDLNFHGIEAELIAARDITDRKVAEERVRFLAYYDALTGLPNRTLLQDRLAKALADARRQKDKVAVVFLDLDRFKDINDSLGHSVGDLLLKEVAERLETLGREQDTIARLGGDEFLIMLTHLKDMPDAAVVIERFMDAFTGEFVVQGRSLNVSCSLGISVFPEHGVDGETLIKNADAAMYSAKESGRNNFRFFSDDMNAQVVERLTLERGLRLAMEKEELFLVYQPQMNIATGKITGLEALLRWQHPELGLIAPDKFIRIAENSGLIVPIGEWVLRTACSQARKWHEQGLSPVTIAVNVSAVQFRHEGFCELIRRLLHETGIAAKYLELELTESLLLANAELMLSVVRELKTMGLTLAIDDFGTGYSSFSYLRQFQISKLKIDRSFIQEIVTNADDAAITAAIISMAKSLRLKVIAEGVEDEAQMSFLREHQCDEIQGYYFSKPLTSDKVADKLRGDGPELHDLADVVDGPREQAEQRL
jgi:diguanylate cyclase (GGDEF)-like protein/PAS domain S-box-containing protein